MDDDIPMDIPQAKRVIEALLFASQAPLSLHQITNYLPEKTDIAAAIAELTQDYQGRGVELRRIGDAYAFRTAADMAEFLQHEVIVERKLSRAAIETLAIIAYHQPTTRAEIEEIRGVAVSRGTLDQLLELEWIRLGKRRETPGRPVTFLTTIQFLDHFGLSTAKDLPGVAELRQAGLLERSPLDGEGQLPIAEGDDEVNSTQETLDGDASDE